MNHGASASLRLHEAAAPLALLGTIGTGVLAMGIVSIAGHTSASDDFAVPALGVPMLSALIAATNQNSLDPLIGPAGSRPLFWLILVLLLLPLLAGGFGLAWSAMSRQVRAGSAQAALAGKRDYRDMYGKGAEKRAVKLRPSLAGREVHERDLGFRLGRLDSGDIFGAGEILYGSEEDVFLEIAGPRSNKTSAQVVPAVLSAPGPVITTSNKVDVYILTSKLRDKIGRVFACDPQGIAGVKQTWWCDLLAGINDMADAQQVMQHFSATVGAGSAQADPYFTSGAERLLCQLTLAATKTELPSLRQVRDWLSSPRNEEPVAILHEAGLSEVAKGLQGTIEAPDEQRGGLYETALTALRCLESEAVARYVTPPQTWATPPKPGEHIEEFEPWQFLVGYENDERGNPVARDTLYLLTREGAGTAAPVVAALTDKILLTAMKAASARGGRNDPPPRGVLDEVANTCPIKNLPDLFSYFGSMSIELMAFLQSYKQGVHEWGDVGMDKLWSASTVKLIGAGVHDDKLGETVSRILGRRDIPTWTHQYGRGGYSSSVTTRREQIMEISDIAHLAKTDAILIASGRRSGRIKLMPWYTEHDNVDIREYADQALREVKDAAIEALPEDNPLAQILKQERDERSTP